MDIEQCMKDIYTYIKEEINYSKDFDVGINIIEEGIIDSMGILTLVSFLETKFAIEIDLEEITVDNFSSIRAITTCVHRKIVGQESESMCQH